MTPIEAEVKIISALKKLGPSRPFQIADSSGIDPERLKNYLPPLLKRGAAKAAGATSRRLYALPDQDLKAALDALPPPSGKPKRPKKAKRGRPSKAKAAKHRHQAFAPRSAYRKLAGELKRPSRANGEFIAALTHERCIVLFRDGAPQTFSREQSLAIADLVLDHFEA